MKSPRFTLPLVLLLAGVVVSIAHADDDDPYAQFRIPDHTWSSWQLNGNASGGTRSGGSFNGQVRQSDIRGDLGTQFERGYDSDRCLHSFAVGLIGFGAHRRTEFEQALQHTKDTNRSNDGAESISLGGRVRTYPWEVPLGVELGASAIAQFGQSAADRSFSSYNAFRVLDHTDSRHDDNTERVVGSASLGLGRVRDATGVYRAQLLALRLLRTGALTHRLSHDAVQRLAQLFSIESDFNSAHELPAKYFWREVERILRDDGALTGESLDAYSVLRALDPNGYPNFTRRAGFFVGPSVSAVVTWRGNKSHEHRVNQFFQDDSLVGGSDETFDSRLANRRDEVQVGAVAEYHRPFGMRLQTDAQTQVYYARDGHLLTAFSQARIDYTIADRWFAGAGVQHQLFEFNVGHDATRPAWWVRCSGNLGYWLEDSFSVNLIAETDQQNLANGLERVTQFSLGFTYRIAGSLSAPGVIEAQRLSPGGY
jgi:hypothetical protein